LQSDRPTPLERAFELARSGECANLTELKKRLTAEGLSASQIEGPTLSRQLRALCVAASEEASRH
jgi:hypothetical protein